MYRGTEHSDTIVFSTSHTIPYRYKAWVDGISTISFPQLMSLGGGKRWVSTMGGTLDYLIAQPDTVDTVKYYGQQLISATAKVIAPGLALSSANPIGLHAFQIGNSVRVGSVWNGDTLRDSWLDWGQPVWLGAHSDSPPDSQRWQYNLAGTSPQWIVGGPGAGVDSVLTASYYHQEQIAVGLLGTASDNTVDVQRQNEFAASVTRSPLWRVQ